MKRRRRWFSVATLNDQEITRCARWMTEPSVSGRAIYVSTAAPLDVVAAGGASDAAAVIEGLMGMEVGMVMLMMLFC